MNYQEIKSKLEEINRQLNQLYQYPQKISDAVFEHLRLQLFEFEDLVGSEMDEAEMFYVEGQLEEIERKLGNDT